MADWQGYWQPENARINQACHQPVAGSVTVENGLVGLAGFYPQQAVQRTKIK